MLRKVLKLLFFILINLNFLSVFAQVQPVRYLLTVSSAANKTAYSKINTDKAALNGTPLLSTLTNAYHDGTSSNAVVKRGALASATLKQSIITLPSQNPVLDANDNYNPGATSTNNETPITYTSSNTAVAIVTAGGLIHIVAPGLTTITANQAGNMDYSPAEPVFQQLEVTEGLSVNIPAIADKTVCDADFPVDATSSDLAVAPLTYTSSNTAVATVSFQGIIHITGAGQTIITVSQNVSIPFYFSATPKFQTLTVTSPVLPGISIAATYSSPCEGTAVTFMATTQNGGAKPTYKWLVNNVNTGVTTTTFTSSSLANNDKVVCMVTNTDNSCVSTYPVTSNVVAVTLIAPSAPTVSIVAAANYVFAGVAVTFTATVKKANGAVNYQWYVNSIPAGINSAIFTGNTFANGDVVTCTITPITACSAPATSNPLTVTIVSEIHLTNAFTPNGDGINDTWDIRGLSSYPNNQVNIFNRYGIKVFQSKGYQQPWDGTINGKQLPVATYYYVIDLGFQNKILSGYVTIIR